MEGGADTKLAVHFTCVSKSSPLLDRVGTLEWAFFVRLFPETP